MWSHIAKHLAANNFLIDQQHGFRQCFSCETQLISAIIDWAKCINQRSQTDLNLLDHSKALDSLPYQRLLLKLDYYGICRYLDFSKILSDTTNKLLNLLFLPILLYGSEVWGIYDKDDFTKLGRLSLKLTMDVKSQCRKISRISNQF